MPLLSRLRRGDGRGERGDAQAQSQAVEPPGQAQAVEAPGQTQAGDTPGQPEASYAGHQAYPGDASGHAAGTAVASQATQPESVGAPKAADEAAVPSAPTKLPRRAWLGVLKRTFREYRNDNLNDHAAALTYYGILAVFPAIIALISILGLFGRSATQSVINNLSTVAPGPARQILLGAVHGLQRSHGAAGVLFIVGLLGALWSASSYIAAFMRSSNAIYDVPEGRPIWKTVPLRFVVTVVLVVMLAAGAFAVVVTGGLAQQVGKLLGIGNSAVTVWDYAKWPVLALMVTLMFSILYWAAPNVKHPGFSWLSPGGLFALVVWLVASAAFAFYVAHFSSYNKTYGALAGVIIFLVWLWLTNLSVLLGAELNAEIARGRRLEAGAPDEEPFLEPRGVKS